MKLIIDYIALVGLIIAIWPLSMERYMIAVGIFITYTAYLKLR